MPLVNGLTQLEELVKEKQYGEVAQTLSVSSGLSSSLNISLYASPRQSGNYPSRFNHIKPYLGYHSVAEG